MKSCATSITGAGHVPDATQDLGTHARHDPAHHAQGAREEGPGDEGSGRARTGAQDADPRRNEDGRDQEGRGEENRDEEGLDKEDHDEESRDQESRDEEDRDKEDHDEEGLDQEGGDDGPEEEDGDEEDDYEKVRGEEVRPEEVDRRDPETDRHRDPRAGAATTPAPKRTGSFRARPDRTATPVDDAGPAPAPTGGPVIEHSAKAHQPIERELPGPQGSQVRHANPQRNLVRRIPR